ncbi:hypothetical protein F5Y13DRAFT_197556 [Hypoxylon sp. FL1857]|nr:hypothetical protein F5Y13DRAFT_197556 [Hypoxylon sp. FL1857]
MSLLTFLLLPLYVLADTPQDLTPAPTLTPAGPIVYAPDINRPKVSHDNCDKSTYYRSNTSNPATWEHCLYIRDMFPRFGYGEFTLNRTTDPNDENDWNLLYVFEKCAILVRNTAPTAVGDADVHGLINDVCYDSCSEGVVEEKGTFDLCTNNVTVDFWMRGVIGLDLDAFVTRPTIG